MDNWFIPELEDFPSQRSLLHLGLNKAVRYYRELVVPGIGGVWFVRQLSWALAGIKLAEDLNRRGQASQIANAIEALACKLNKKYPGIRGIRAFERDPKVWEFSKLSQPKYYVQVTFRQSTVRALVGLGYTRGGLRFNGMELTPVGRELVNALFLGNSVEKKIKNWIRNANSSSRKPVIAKEALGRDNASTHEKENVRDRLLTEVQDDFGSPNRRAMLIKAFKNNERMPSVEKIKDRLQHQQVLEINTAEAFDAMVGKARSLIQECAQNLESTQDCPVSEMAKKLKKPLVELQKKSKTYLAQANKSKQFHQDAQDFAEKVTRSTPEDVLEVLAKRDGSIVVFSDDKVLQGPLFDRHDQKKNDITDQDEDGGEKEVGTEDSSTPRKIKQLFKLWKDCCPNE